MKSAVGLKKAFITIRNNKIIYMYKLYLKIFKLPKLKIRETSTFFSFFSKVQKVLIQPPRKPRKQHLGDVRPKKFEQNKMTGRVDILAHIREKCKKVKNEVTGTEKRCFWLIYLKTFNKFIFLGPVTSILTFVQFSQKCARVYRPFRPFCHLLNFL